ncbi:hypothetical protein [Humibacillus xanthopallidus]|nr:hypothetical protein [Humibacillus xanthopallidus]
MSAPTTLLPFHLATMTSARLAAVWYLARYCRRTHALDGSSCGCELGLG